MIVPNWKQIFLILATSNGLLACANTADDSQSDIQVNLPITQPEIPAGQSLDTGFSQPDIPISESVKMRPQGTQSPPQSRSIEDILAGQDQSNHVLIHKHICKWSSAQYRVADNNGYMNSFQTKVQLQAKVVNVSPNGDIVRFKLTGWYTEDQTFKAWAPRLRKPAISEGFKLILDAEYSDDLDEWSVCKLTEG